MHYFSGKGCSESLESMHYCIGILTCTEVDENVKIGDFQQGIDIKKARKLLEIKDSENQDCLECREYKQCTACKCIMVNYDLHRDFYKVPLIECEITKMLYEILRKNFSEKQFDILRISS